MALLHYYKGPFPDGGNPASTLWAFARHLVSHLNLDKTKKKRRDAWIPAISDHVKVSLQNTNIGENFIDKGALTCWTGGYTFL